MKKIFVVLIFLVVTGAFGETARDRRYKFINEGFGFSYSEDEIEDIDLFVSRHGSPLCNMESA